MAQAKRERQSSPVWEASGADLLGALLAQPRVEVPGLHGEPKAPLSDEARVKNDVDYDLISPCGCG